MQRAAHRPPVFVRLLRRLARRRRVVDGFEERPDVVARNHHSEASRQPIPVEVVLHGPVVAQREKPLRKPERDAGLSLDETGRGNLRTICARLRTARASPQRHR